MTIIGPSSANPVIISTDSNYSIPYVFNVFSGNTVTITNLTIKNNKIGGFDFDFDIGVIVNQGTLTLAHCNISANSPPDNNSDIVGIVNYGTMILKDNSVVSNNNALGISNYKNFTSYDSIVSYNRKGAIDNYYDGEMTIQGSMIIKNINVESGRMFNPSTTYHQLFGGISNEGQLKIANSLISDNSVSSVVSDDDFDPSSITSDIITEGGGILNKRALTVTNSAVVDNKISIMNNTSSHLRGVSFTINSGGGIINDDLDGFSDITLRISNSTIANNTASIKGFDPQTTTLSSSGGITNYGGQVDITFCTIYNNNLIGQEHGGGIFTGDGEDDNGNKTHGSLRIKNSIVVGNQTNNGGSDIAGTLHSGGYNLFQNSAGANIISDMPVLPDVSVQPGTDLKIVKIPNDRQAQLPPPADMLLPGSPARDQIPEDACNTNGITTDQLGTPRLEKGKTKCDIGAYEARS